jgi:transcriptional regulator with XRE-family HTH domain
MKPGKLLSVRIKALREAAGLSQQELANRADLSVSQVAKLEQGSKADPRTSTLLALAMALEIKPGQLLDELPWPPAKETKKGGKGKKKDKKARKEKGHKEKKVKGKKAKGKKLPAVVGHPELGAGENGVPAEDRVTV